MSKKSNGISEYIRWMGRFPFSRWEFNELDAIVLCVISYFDLRPAIDEGYMPLTVGGCLRALEDGRLKLQITGGDMGNSEIFRAAAQSERFGGLVITDYEDILRPEIPLQFSAVTFHSADGLSFIAYRGTDETIAGWKEDFMISFTHTEAQRMAAEYAGRIIRPGRRYRIGGHSKGGNQALYAACTLEEPAWELVDHVYILDGPGLCPEVMDTAAVGRVDPRATRVIPSFSVIGKLFEPRITDTRIVRSSAAGILQHSLSSWGVDHGALDAVTENDPTSVFINEVLDRWIENIPQEGRQALTDELFDALAAGGAVTLSDIAGSGPQGFEAVLMGLFRTSDSTKKIMKELQRETASAVWKRLRQETPAKPRKGDDT